MEDATRLSPGVQAVTDHIDATRVAHTPDSDSDKTRIARDTRPVDLETEGTRILGIGAITSVNSAERELSEHFKIGERIGTRYEVFAIYRGSMGVVYGAYDHKDRRPVALKALQLRFTRNTFMQDLFAAEAATWIKLGKHPFIVRAYSIGRFGKDLWNQQPFVITEYIRGQENMGADLRSWLGHPRLSLQLALEMALQISQGMQHACRKVPGMVHRDLKPANILVDDRAKAMVTDFGLVGAEGAGAGTPAYMAPEQWRGELLDARTDIYAYGCILYEMFTGHRMHMAHSEDEWQTAHLSLKPASVKILQPQLPDGISSLIERCIAKLPANRPPDWNVVVSECAHFFHDITGQPVVLDYPSDSLTEYDLYNTCYALWQLRKFADAISLCNQALSINPNHALALRCKAIGLWSLKHFDDALAALNAATTIAPAYADGWADKGQLLYQLNRHVESVEACDVATKIDPQHSRAWSTKADALNKLDRLDEANVACRKAFAFDRQLANNNGIDAEAWKRLNHHEYIDAPAPLAVVTSDHPDAAAAYLQGGILHKLFRLKESIAAYDCAIRIRPDYIAAWKQKARIQAIDGFPDNVDYDAVVKSWEGILAIDPYNIDALTGKASALNLRKRYAEALVAYDSLLALDMKCARYWTGRGESLCGLERHEEAVAAFEKSSAIDPIRGGGFLALPFGWGNSIAKLSNPDDALRAYDRMLDVYPYEDYFWQMKGQLLHKLNRYKDAICAYDQAIAINPTRTDTISHRKMSLQKLECPDKSSTVPCHLPEEDHRSQKLPDQDRPKTTLRTDSKRKSSFWSRLLGKIFGS